MGWNWKRLTERQHGSSENTVQGHTFDVLPAAALLTGAAPPAPQRVEEQTDPSAPYCNE